MIQSSLTFDSPFVGKLFSSILMWSCLFSNFSQICKFISFGLGTVKSERVKKMSQEKVDK